MKICLQKKAKRVNCSGNSQYVCYMSACAQALASRSSAALDACILKSSLSKPVLRSTPSQWRPGLIPYLFGGAPIFLFSQLWLGTSCTPAFPVGVVEVEIMETPEEISTWHLSALSKLIAPRNSIVATTGRAITVARMSLSMGTGCPRHVRAWSKTYWWHWLCKWLKDRDRCRLDMNETCLWYNKTWFAHLPCYSFRNNGRRGSRLLLPDQLRHWISKSRAICKFHRVTLDYI